MPIDSLVLFEALTPKTRAHRLKRLLTHEDHYIRRALARNLSFPVEHFMVLTSDLHQDVSNEAVRILKLVETLHRNVKPGEGNYAPFTTSR